MGIANPVWYGLCEEWGMWECVQAFLEFKPC